MAGLPTASQAGEVWASLGAGAFHNLNGDHGDTEGGEGGGEEEGGKVLQPSVYGSASKVAWWKPRQSCRHCTNY